MQNRSFDSKESSPMTAKRPMVNWWASHRDLRRLVANCPYRSRTAAARARWLVLFYQSRANFDLLYNGDELAERYGITERTFDTCFEQGDGEDVLVAFMGLVLADPDLTDTVRNAVGAADFAADCKRAADANKQLSLI